METNNIFLTISQIKHDLKMMLKSIDRTNPEGNYFYMSILNILRFTGEPDECSDS